MTNFSAKEEVSSVNIPLLRKSVEWAEAEAVKPWRFRQWNQQDWLKSSKDFWGQTRDAFGRFIRGGKRLQKDPSCGTCCCIAGWVALEAGAQEIPHMPGMCQTPDGELRVVAELARKELGLSYQQGSHLFNADNTIKDIRRIAEAIAGERL